MAFSIEDLIAVRRNKPTIEINSPVIVGNVALAIPEWSDAPGKNLWAPRNADFKLQGKHKVCLHRTRKFRDGKQGS